MKQELVGPQSKALRGRALGSIPGGVNSNIRLSAPPVLFDRAAGARMWDVDGREYIDYVLGQGPHFLGHACSRINSAVTDACDRGMLFGATHALEVEAAELVLDALGWAERVRLGVTGTECVQAALRLSRAVTGRRRFVRFEGHYHGWMDNILLGPPDDDSRRASDGQLADYLGDSLVVGWNDADALAETLQQHGDEICAVIMEPMMVNTGGIVPLDGYLQRVRQLCDQYGVVLIFDEVITGFRLARGGAAEVYQVAPDLAIYGKAIGGGWPVAALAGRADLMHAIGTGAVNHAGTFNGSVMAAAAVVATQQLLAEDPPYDHVNEYGNALMKGLEAAAQEHEVPLHVQGVPAAFHVSLEPQASGSTVGPGAPARTIPELEQLDLEGYASLTDQFVQHGLWVMKRGIWFVSAAHGPDELSDTLERFTAALDDRP